MADTYRTVAGRAQADFEVQGSEFLGHVAPADSVAEAEAFLEEVRAAYDDATHNVPAYRVPAGDGGGMLREWANDDGEPTGSAGKPALNVLVQRDLRNVVVVVTRYYGGVNLGVGGLARSYARAVSDAVEAAGVVEERPHERLAITVDYDDSGTVRGILESEGVDFEAAYEARVAFDARVPVAEADALRDRLRSATGGRVELG
jgi:uncharacterized YigZ family protein